MSCFLVYTGAPVIDLPVVPGYQLSGFSSSPTVQLTPAPQSSIHSNQHLTSEICQNQLSSYQEAFSKCLSNSFGVKTPSFQHVFQLNATYTNSLVQTGSNPQRHRQSSSLSPSNDSNKKIPRQRFRVRKTPYPDNSSISTFATITELSYSETVVSSTTFNGGQHYCHLCRVKLNAAGQAKQHYEGKIHAKKVKLAELCFSSNETTAAKPSFNEHTDTKPLLDEAVEAKQHRQPSIDSIEQGKHSTTSSSKYSPNESNQIKTIDLVSGNPDVYCSTCGISFNSDKQSRQHYKGRLHFRKQRLANHLIKRASRSSLKLECVSNHVADG